MIRVEEELLRERGDQWTRNFRTSLPRLPTVYRPERDDMKSRTSRLPPSRLGDPGMRGVHEEVGVRVDDSIRQGGRAGLGPGGASVSRPPQQGRFAAAVRDGPTGGRADHLRGEDDRPVARRHLAVGPVEGHVHACGRPDNYQNQNHGERVRRPRAEAARPAPRLRRGRSCLRGRARDDRHGPRDQPRFRETRRRAERPLDVPSQQLFSH